MKNKKVILYGFIFLALIQLMVPLSMIARREMTLNEGVQYKFRTAPVDPYDAFRGKYVALRFDEEGVEVSKSDNYFRGQKVFAVLEEGKDGFTKISGLSLKKPLKGDYIKARVKYSYNNRVQINLPFDRYYMNEKDAPEAEAAYRKHSRGEERDAYVSVRVKSGFAVLEELFIQDRPIKEFLKEKKS